MSFKEAHDGRRAGSFQHQWKDIHVYTFFLLYYFLFSTVSVFFQWITGWSIEGGGGVVYLKFRASAEAFEKDMHNFICCFFLILWLPSVSLSSQFWNLLESLVIWGKKASFSTSRPTSEGTLYIAFLIEICSCSVYFLILSAVFFLFWSLFMWLIMLQRASRLPFQYQHDRDTL